MLSARGSTLSVVIIIVATYGFIEEGETDIAVLDLLDKDLDGHESIILEPLVSIQDQQTMIRHLLTLVYLAR